MYHVTLMLRRFPKKFTFIRNVSLFSDKCRQKEETKENFIPVYKFPYIVPFSMINRLKLYQTVLTATSIPTAAVLNQLNYISFDAVEFTTSLGLSGCITLYGMGYLTNKFIGFVYYNEATETAKISYIDFFGRRKDVEIPAKDIVPIVELPIAPMDGLFLTIRRYSTKDTLRLNLKYGIILDKEKIKKVF